MKNFNVLFINSMFRYFICKKFIPIFISALAIVFLSFGILSGQEKIILSGTVYDDITKKPVDFATIFIPELKIKKRVGLNGEFSIVIPEKGTYDVYVVSTGLGSMQAKVEINGSLARDFIIKPAYVRGATLTVKDEKEKQKVSRKTMTVEELKEVPASFGDSMNALTSMPGIDRTNGGFFGPLVIRGANPYWNRYYIDGIPINEPMHFGGLHAVIANDLMSEIDVYASAFPSKYGGPLAAVIDINTLDTVKEFGGIFDVGLISATTLLKMPIKKTVMDSKGELEEQNSGYFIASGRIGYLTLLIPLIYKLITNNELTYLPEYYDYQFKARYYFDKFNSISFLALGSSDTWKIAYKQVSGKSEYDKGEDPLHIGSNFMFDQSFHNFGTYYTFDTGLFKNTLMAYASLSRQYFYINSGPDAAAWAKDLYMDSKPYIYGIKDNFSFEWIKKVAEIRGAFEYTYYKFMAKGKSLVAMEQRPTGGEPDLGNAGLFTTLPVDLDTVNITYSAFVDNKFTFGDFKFIPGVHWDYLERAKESIVSPRGMASYKFPTETTISLAGGLYKSFFQTNPYFFAQNPEYSTYGNFLQPEKAVHTVAGIEQKYDLYTFSIEGYYNYFYNLAVAYGHLDAKHGFVEGQNSGELKAMGFEIMIRKDKRQGFSDYFGWVSYTYNQSVYRSGITGSVYDKASETYLNEKFDPNGDRWIRNDFERVHTLKLVGGYKWENFTISGRFQLYTSFPFTPIVGNEPPTMVGDRTRYAPVYGTDVNSKHFPVDHRLDIRLSYQSNYKWGYIKWYIEVINAYGYWYTAKDEYFWAFNKPYSSGENPRIKQSDQSLPFIPNFGIEVKF